MLRAGVLAAAALAAAAQPDSEVPDVFASLDAAGLMLDPATLPDTLAIAPDVLDGLAGSLGGNAGGRKRKGGKKVKAAESEGFVLPPGRVIEFPGEVKPRSFALSPTRGAVVVSDGAVHGNKWAVELVAAQQGWWARTWQSLFGKPQPYPFAYMTSASTGEVMRSLEFVDRSVLALGLSEGGDGRLAITFYQGPGLEVWHPSLDEKMTFHEFSVKPALPVFDAEGLLWVPYTIADRLNEEGEGIVALWAYRGDGSRWEAFPRRQFPGVKYPHTVHLDQQGRIALAGLTSWVFNDGTYGQELKEDVDPAGVHTKLEIYTLTADPAHPAYQAEQRGRWAEQHSGNAPEEGDEAGVAAIRFGAAVALEASYAFPFNTCLWPLFVLTGDGHAITACHGGDRLRVLRYGYPVAGEAGLQEVFAAEERASTLPERKRLREAWAPSPPAGYTAVRLLPAEEAAIVADVAAPYGLGSIAGLQMEPNGRAFSVLDAGLRRVVSVPWPWPGLEAPPPPPAGEASTPPPLPELLTSAPPLPRGERVLRVPAIPRSS